MAEIFLRRIPLLPQLLGKRELVDVSSKAIDLFYGMAVNNHRFTKPFFEHGWGNLDCVDLTQDARATNPALPLPDLQITWERLKEGRHQGVRYELLQGTFDTPMQGDLRVHLPPECLTARVQLLRPVDHPAPDLAIHLAGTGDHGFFRRMSLGYGLLKDGIGSMVLESPYYGNRRPTQQVRSKLRHVSDLLLLGRTTIEESLCLLQWARTNGYNRLCMAGLSMGGVHSVMVSALAQHDVACAPLLAPHSASEAFCQGLLWFGTSQRWTPERHLSPVSFKTAHGQLNGVEGSSVDQTEAARRRLARALDITDTTTFPLPRRPDASVFVAAASDLYVSMESIERIHRHWPGSELRRVAGGHVSAFILQGNEFRKAIRDAIDKL
eukprot:comp22046_c1_seq1/m.32038 comp22046_c1_seq1/g.32038  ORF comp22046_c1_seq1/g.32038 comp22046_c1_seq1/m.32038 type:complete len:381 (-) comp22046_c1_seq1:542-1684(-)